VHCNKVGVIFCSWEGTLYVVVASMLVLFWIADGKVPLPDAKLIKRIGKVEFRFVDFISPIVDGERSWVRSETTTVRIGV
jgi:hypothetical protein